MKVIMGHAAGIIAADQKAGSAVLMDIANPLHTRAQHALGKEQRR